MRTLQFLYQDATLAARNAGYKELRVTPAGQISGMLREGTAAQAAEIVGGLPVDLPAATS